MQAVAAVDLTMAVVFSTVFDVMLYCDAQVVVLSLRESTATSLPMQPLRRCAVSTPKQGSCKPT